jgi:hypothetical protein
MLKDDLQPNCDPNMIYLIPGELMNRLIRMVIQRTPKAAAPLTATYDPDGVSISAEEFKMVVCVENASEELEEKDAMVLGQLIDDSGA